MADAGSTITDRLVRTEAVQNLVVRNVKDTTQPAVFYGQWSPAGQTRPYLLVNFESNETFQQQRFMRSGTIWLDAFSDGPSTKRVRDIRDACVLVLDSEIIEDSEGHFYRISELKADASAPTEDPSVAHWRFGFNVRYFRQAIVNAKFA